MRWMRNVRTIEIDYIYILKPFCFICVFILFDGSGDINFFLMFCSYFCSLLIFSSSSPSTLLQRRASRWMQASSILALPATYKALFV